MRRGRAGPRDLPPHQWPVLPTLAPSRAARNVYRARPGKRAVTLVQWEHLPAIAALAGLDHLDPGLLRRNIAVAGFNLSGLRGREFRLGTATLMGTGACAPCSRMEAALGQGGYAAMRGHGGITAEVLAPGNVTLGDILEPLD